MGTRTECKQLEKLVDSLCKYPTNFSELTKTIKVECPPNVPDCISQPYFVLKQQLREYIMEYLMLRSPSVTKINKNNLFIIISKTIIDTGKYTQKNMLRFNKVSKYEFEEIRESETLQKDDETSRFVYVPLLIVTVDKESGGMLNVHSVLVLVDHLNKEIEYFDSNGPSECDSPFDLSQKCVKKIMSNLYPEHKFVEMIEFCPMSCGPQTFTELPHCGVWSALYAFLRSYCPSVERIKIVDRMNEHEELANEFTEGSLSEKFLCYMWNIAIDTGLLNAFVNDDWDGAQKIITTR